MAGGKYELPVSLPANASSMIGLMDLIKMAQPDAHGNVIPVTVQQGSATIANVSGIDQPMIIGVSAGSFNVKKATCQSGCTLCSGVTGIVVSPNPGSVLIGANLQMTATKYLSNGSSSTVTGTSAWSSDNTSNATVGANTGSVSGVAAGSANITASYYAIAGGVCPVPPTYDGGCQDATFTDTSAVTVQVPTSSRIVSTIWSYAINSSSSPACPSGQAGWYRRVHKIVTDQNGHDITLDGQSLTESVAISQRNDLQIGSVMTGSTATMGGGYFDDILSVCSPVCPSSTGATDATQTISDVLPGQSQSRQLTTNNFHYTCTGNTINSQ